MSLLSLENICFNILNFSGLQSHANCRLYLLVIHTDFQAVPYLLTQNQQDQQTQCGLIEVLATIIQYNKCIQLSVSWFHLINQPF